VTFGDVDADDVFAAEAPPAPEQVAYRLHALRRELDVLTGRDPGRWEDLTAAEQSLALSIGVVIVEWLATHDPDDPTAAARSLHEVRRYLTHGVLAPWDDLTADERALAVDVMTLVFAWLRRQGAIP
jgi:hypothetical protein